MNDVLADEGRYVHSEGDANWWIPSGRIFHSLGSNDTAAEELGHARAHFFLPHRYRDPFHTTQLNTTQLNTETIVTYDDHRLLVVETRDALGNTVRAQNDYRVLAPRVMTDPNGNRSEVEFDALGMVVATAVKGKLGQNLGDLLEDVDPNPPLAALQAFVANPQGQAASLLGKATTRVVYDLDRYQRSGQPPFAATLARETHFADPGGAQTKIQVSFSYSDGFGREIQKKIQAERGDAPHRGPNVTLPSGDVQPGALVRDANGKPVQADTLQRWVGSGRTVFNNKGKPVRQYEPFFSSTPLYEAEREMTDTGVSPMLFYDPVERVVATLHPNHTWEKVVFDPWQQTTYDVNDTVLNPDGTTDPKRDSDVQGFFARLPDADYLPTWYEQRSALAANDPERVAAEKAAVHRQTPTLAHLDTLGRTFLTFADNGPDPAQPGMHLLFATRALLDIEGNQREVVDAKNRVVMRYDYDMLGNHIHQASMEAGARWMLNNVAGKPIRAWDDRNFMRSMTYDALQRPTGLFVTEPAGERLAEQTIYGEDKPSPADTNHRGKVWQVRDDAGIVTSDEYDFKGSLLSGKRDLRTEYQTPVNWAQLPAPATSETFTSSSTFDALGRVIEAVAPDGSVTLPRYNEANLLEAVEVRLPGAAQPTPFVRNIDYDAKGQRTRIEYNEAGHPISTEYTYDRDTFRLTHLVTTRPSHSEADKRTLQDLRYTYDPVGNITHIQDDAQQTIYFRNQRVEPSNDYIYDAVYRLINAQGREHLGQTDGQRNPPTAPDAFNQFHTHLDHPGNGDALGTYIEAYEYDAVGNFKAMHHRGSDPVHPGWTRSYAYNEPSLVEPATQKSNRLSSTQIGAGTPEAYTHDAHGNMTVMPHLPTLRWDFEDQLTQVDLQGGGTAYYVYDAGGQRVRKVVERNGATVEERIYLGGYEVYRKRQGGVLQLERQTLHIMDDKQRIALVETKTIDDRTPIPDPQPLIRYQFGNHLGSASLELDDVGQIISYEEYTPYGSTSYQGISKDIKAAGKRYRYTGMERDEESGFGYHGARYYVQWLGRWLGCDPIGIKDGLNLYEYVKSNPIILIDPTGTDGSNTDIAQLMQQQLNIIIGQIDKTKDILRRDTESESKARQALSGLLSEKNQNQKAIEEKQKEIGEKQKDIQEKRNQLAVLEEMAYTVDQVRLRAKRPDWFPDPPSQILGAVAGPFIGAVGVPSYYVKTEVSRQAMIDAQTGAEYFEARDKYNAAHANVALGRINEEIARYFGAVMELSGAMINFGSIRPKASGGGGNNPGGRRPPGGIPGGGDDEPGGGPPSGGGGNKPGGGGSEPSSTALTRQTPKTGAVQRTLNNLRRAVDAVKRANEGYKDLKLGISIKIRNLYDKATNFFKK